MSCVPDSADDRVIDSSDDERVGERRVSGSGQKALKEANFGVDQPWIEWSSQKLMNFEMVCGRPSALTGLQHAGNQNVSVRELVLMLHRA